METEFKGTPGPWLVDKTTTRHGGIDNHRTVVYRVSDDKEPYHTIGDIYGPGEDGSRANAKLIAAAPTMLEALQIIANENPSTVIGYTKEQLIEIANQAINTALNG